MYDVIISPDPNGRIEGQCIASIVGVEDSDITVMSDETREAVRGAVVAYLRRYKLPKPHTVNFL